MYVSYILKPHRTILYVDARKSVGKFVAKSAKNKNHLMRIRFREIAHDRKKNEGSFHVE